MEQDALEVLRDIRALLLIDRAVALQHHPRDTDPPEAIRIIEDPSGRERRVRTREYAINLTLAEVAEARTLIP